MLGKPSSKENTLSDWGKICVSLQPSNSVAGQAFPSPEAAFRVL